MKVKNETGQELRVEFRSEEDQLCGGDTILRLEPGDGFWFDPHLRPPSSDFIVIRCWGDKPK